MMCFAKRIKDLMMFNGTRYWRFQNNFAMIMPFLSIQKKKEDILNTHIPFPKYS